MVSSIPGFREALGLKPSTARLHRACLKTLDSHDLCAFTKRAFNFQRKGKKLDVEGGINNFINYAHSLSTKKTQEWPQLWIFKPQESFLGEGIRLLKITEKDVETRKGISAWASKNFPNGKWTLQEYVRSPALYKGRKFDIRIWAVVTSIEPLSIHILHHGFPKVSTKQYSPDVGTMGDLCMHIKMPLGPDCVASELVRPYPKSTRDRTWDGGLAYGSLGDGKDGGRGGGEGEGARWREDVWPQIEDQINLVVIGGVEKIKHRIAEVFNNSPANKDRYNRFVLLSPDFAFDASGHVYMEEMNTNGFMIGDTYSSFFPAQASTVQLLKLLGAGGQGERGEYGESAERAVEGFFEEHPRENTGRARAVSFCLFTFFVYLASSFIFFFFQFGLAIPFSKGLSNTSPLSFSLRPSSASSTRT